MKSYSHRVLHLKPCQSQAGNHGTLEKLTQPRLGERLWRKTSFGDIAISIAQASSRFSASQSRAFHAILAINLHQLDHQQWRRGEILGQISVSCGTLPG